MSSGTSTPTSSSASAWPRDVCADPSPTAPRTVEPHRRAVAGAAAGVENPLPAFEEASHLTEIRESVALCNPLPELLLQARGVGELAPLPLEAKTLSCLSLT